MEVTNLSGANKSLRQSTTEILGENASPGEAEVPWKRERKAKTICESHQGKISYENEAKKRRK